MLTTKQVDKRIARREYVRNKIYRLLCDLAGQEVPWIPQAVGEIADIAERVICDVLELMSNEEFLPVENEQLPKAGSCLGKCTRVRLADGSKRAIEDIETGTVVRTVSAELEPSTVRVTCSHCSWPIDQCLCSDFDVDADMGAHG